MRKIMTICASCLFGFNPTLVKSMYNDDSAHESGRTRQTSHEKTGQEDSHKKAGIASLPFINKEDVELISGKGSKKSGGGVGGHYWNVFAKGVRAGKIFINWINQEPLGEHASIQIFLNKPSQGKHIGRHAYEMACHSSRYDEVYAYMSKKNLASIRSAKAAGFVQILADTTAQVLMKWTRKKKD